MTRCRLSPSLPPQYPVATPLSPLGVSGTSGRDPACCSPSAAPSPGLGTPPEGAGGSSQQGTTLLPTCPHCPPQGRTPRWAPATRRVLGSCWGSLLVTRDQAAGWARPTSAFSTVSRIQGQGHMSRVLGGCAVRTWTKGVTSVCMTKGSVTGYSRFFTGTLCPQPTGEGDRAGSLEQQALTGPDHLPWGQTRGVGEASRASGGNGSAGRSSRRPGMWPVVAYPTATHPPGRMAVLWRGSGDKRVTRGEPPPLPTRLPGAQGWGW